MAKKFAIETIFKATDMVSGTINRMTKSVSKSARTMERAFTGVASATGKISLALGGVATAGGVATIALAKADVRAQQLAKSVGVSVNTIEALTAASSAAGFEFDNVIDLIEEMNNKLGESRGLEEITPVKESLAILGLSFKEISKLNPEKQFLRIADAALKLDDAQKAAAASDILLGGEANKLIGIWRQQGKSIDDVIGRFNKLNFRSQQSRKGSEQLARQVGELSFAFSSFFKEVAGLFSSALAPQLAKLTKWLTDNRKTVEQFMRTFVKGAIEVSKAIGQGIMAAVEDLKNSDLAKWFADLDFKMTESRATFKDVTDLVSALFKTLSAGVQVMVALAAASVTLRAATVALTVSMTAWSVAAGVVTTATAAWSAITAAMPAVLATARAAMLAFNIVLTANPIGVVVTAIGLLVAAAAGIFLAWDPVKQFFVDLWGTVASAFDKGLSFIKNTLSSVSDLLSGLSAFTDLFGDEEEVNVRAEKRREQIAAGDGVISPQESIVRSINENKSSAEVTLRNETNATAEVSQQRGPMNLQIANSGAF
ncbi:TMhelix containing protein [Oceanospirillum phage vB_OsaM_PD0307]|nr:TMhelix containing protein [Oceanospirillum phage vB_OsaM_PD0307]